MGNMNNTFSANIHKYEDIWKQVSDQILSSIKIGSNTEIHLNSTIFNKASSRNSYSFNLEFTNGKVSNNIKGSAVARDLTRVLESKKDFTEIIKGKFVKINMSKEFFLHISTN